MLPADRASLAFSPQLSEGAAHSQFLQRGIKPFIEIFTNFITKKSNFSLEEYEKFLSEKASVC